MSNISFRSVQYNNDGGRQYVCGLLPKKAQHENKRNRIIYGFRNTFYVLKLMGEFFARPVASKSVW